MDRSKIINIHECKMSKDGAIIPPIDDYSQKVLDNILESCEKYYDAAVWEQIPQKPESPLPHHNLYLSFYTALECVAMITEYGLAYAITKNTRYSDKARQWLSAMSKWDHTVFTFYAVARLMHAIVAVLYWIQDEMSDKEIEDSYAFLHRLCLQVEDEAYRLCHGNVTGGHPNLYTAGFGIAALALRAAEMEPKAEMWLSWVLHKYRNFLFPDDGAPDGTYQPDGNWCIVYAIRYKILFLDAYRLVTGEDLIAKNYETVTRQVKYLRYAYMGDGAVQKNVISSNENMLGSLQINAGGPLYLRLASITKDPYLQWIGMANPDAGKILPMGFKVKEGPEYLLEVGYLGYLWYDPAVKPEFRPPEETSRYFKDGELAVLRTRFGDGLTVSYQGRRRGTTFESPDLLINKNGHAMICPAPEKNSLPLSETCCPASGGGEMERKGAIKQLICGTEQDVLDIEGFLTSQRIIVTRGKEEKVSVYLTARNRSESGGTFSEKRPLLFYIESSFLRVCEM